MRPLSTTPVSGGCSPARNAGRPLPSLGQRLRAVVESAVNQRLLLNRMKAGHCPTPVHTALGSLQQWLAMNPYPSEATVRAFALSNAVRMVYPANSGKEAKMAELDTLINNS